MQVPVQRADPHCPARPASLDQPYICATIDLGSLRGLYEHQHELHAYCAH
jgi:hypothetical protein